MIDWHPFDPDDRTTWPQPVTDDENKFLVVVNGDVIMCSLHAYHDGSFSWWEYPTEEYTFHGITHWAYPPPPPPE